MLPLRQGDGQRRTHQGRHVNTKFNVADLFTKGVPKEVLDALEPYLCGQSSLDDLLSKNIEWNINKGMEITKKNQEEDKKEEEV